MVAEAWVRGTGCEQIDGHAQFGTQFDLDADQIGQRGSARYVYEKIEIAAVGIFAAHDLTEDADIRRPDAGHDPAHGFYIGFERFRRFHFTELFRTQSGQNTLPPQTPLVIPPSTRRFWPVM